MVVKEKRGRRRYVLFRLGKEFSKDSLVSEVRRRFPENARPYVIQAKGEYAIFRCEQKETEKTVESILSSFSGSESITTSGTLATIRSKYPELKISKKPAEKRGVRCAHRKVNSRARVCFYIVVTANPLPTRG